MQSILEADCWACGVGKNKIHKTEHHYRSPCPVCGRRAHLQAPILRVMGRNPDQSRDAEGGFRSRRVQDGRWRTIDRFIVKSHLGSGGYGDVYLAWDSVGGFNVALKIADNGLMDPRRAAHLEAEARSAAMFDHRGVVKFYDSGFHENSFWISYEYINGISLYEKLARLKSKGHRLNPRRAVQIALRVAEALKHIHSRSMIHRDVKPANIMLTRSREVKLVDLGLARPATGADADGAASYFAGTPGYAAPEQLMWGSRRVDARSDVYSLGMVLFEMLANTTPCFDVDFRSGPGRLDSVSPRMVDASIPKDLDGVCSRAINLDPAGRYTTIDQFAASLNQWIKRNNKTITTKYFSIFRSFVM